jgi:hypothetical protein
MADAYKVKVCRCPACSIAPSRRLLIYGPDGKLPVWFEDRLQAKRIARGLSEASERGLNEPSRRCC